MVSNASKWSCETQFSEVQQLGNGHQIAEWNTENNLLKYWRCIESTDIATGFFLTVQPDSFFKDYFSFFLFFFEFWIVKSGEKYVTTDIMFGLPTGLHE